MRRAPIGALALALALLAGLAVMALPLSAWACPVCAGRAVANPYQQAALIGGFVFFPFGVVYTVVRYIRAGLRRVDAASIPMNSATDPLRGPSAGSPDLARHSTDDGDR